MSSLKTRKGNSESRVARTQRAPDEDHGPYGLRSRGKRITVEELFGDTDYRKKSWADRCEPDDEDNQSVSSPMKTLSVSENSPRKVLKRERVPDTLALSPSYRDVKRRLGMINRNGSGDQDNASTSSSVYSSDTEEGGEKSQKQYETDQRVLTRRQKQIDYGKNTKGYKLYLEKVPKLERQPQDIFTPKKHIKYSRRSWDTQIKLWRKRLHEYDPQSEDDEDEDLDLSEMAALVHPNH